MDEKEYILNSARSASEAHLKGTINLSEFCLKLLSLLFNSAALVWDSVVACFTESQRQILRSFADDYFSDNGYAPRPDLPPGASAAWLEDSEALSKS
jgi:hypothetical protein